MRKLCARRKPKMRWLFLLKRRLARRRNPHPLERVRNAQCNLLPPWRSNDLYANWQRRERYWHCNDREANE